MLTGRVTGTVARIVAAEGTPVPFASATVSFSARTREFPADTDLVIPDTVTCRLDAQGRILDPTDADGQRLGVELAASENVEGGFTTEVRIAGTSFTTRVFDIIVRSGETTDIATAVHVPAQPGQVVDRLAGLVDQVQGWVDDPDALKGPKGDTGDVTPEAEQALADTVQARDEVVQARDDTAAARNAAQSAAQTATTMAGQTVALQDTAVAAIARDTSSQTRGVIDDVSAAAGSQAATQAIADNPDVIAQAAALAQSDAGLARTVNDRTEKPGGGLVGENGRATDIALTSGGEIVQETIDRWSGRIAPVLERGGFVVEDADAVMQGGGLVGENGRATDLTVDSDGHLLQGTIERMATRLREPLGLDAGLSKKAVLVGHSMLNTASATITSTLAQDGITVTNLAIGGESSPSIVARQGGQPCCFWPAGGSVPASGSVAVTLVWAGGEQAWPLLQGDTSYAGWLVLDDGSRLAGTFSITRDPEATQYMHSDADLYTFTRSTAGTEVPLVGPAPFYYSKAEPTRDDIHVFWVGRNNYSSPDQVMADLEAGILRVGSSNRWLVLSEHNSASGGTGTAEWTAIMALNARLRSRAGRRFIDTRRFFIDHGLAAAGITATAQDQEDIANDVPPTSLRSDSLHENAAGQQLVADLIRSRIKELEMI